MIGLGCRHRIVVLEVVDSRLLIVDDDLELHIQPVWSSRAQRSKKSSSQQF